MLCKLSKITADYNVILQQLRRMYDLTGTVGAIGMVLKKDIEKAEKQCNDCIHRFNAVNECLRVKDYRYIHHQMIFAAQQTRIFEELAKKVHDDAQDLVIQISQTQRRENHDL